MKIRFLITALLVVVLLTSLNVTTSIAAGTTLLDLGTLGGTYSIALDVNEQNQVVGFSSTLDNEESHAFLWQGGQMLDLGTLGGDYSTAAAINNKGQIVGQSNVVAGGNSHAFLWENGVMRDLGLFGGFASAVLDINDRGQILAYRVLSGTLQVRFFLLEGDKITFIEGW